MGVHCRGCLRGFASRFNAPARPPSSSVPSNFADDPEKGTRISLQFRIQFSPVFPRFRFIRYRDWINRLHVLFRARKFYRKFRRNFIFSLFLLVLLVIREVFFRIPSNSKIFRIFYIFFLFFWKLVCISRIFHVSVIFLSSSDRRSDNNARELLFRGIGREAGRLVDFSTDHRGWMERENVETNTSIKWPVADRERDPPRRGYTVAVEEVGGSWRVPLSRFLAGVPRDWMALLPGRHRDARFRSIILTAESMISPLGASAREYSLALLSFFSLRFSPFLPFLSFFSFFAFATRAPLLSQTTAVKATWLF